MGDDVVVGLVLAEREQWEVENGLQGCCRRLQQEGQASHATQGPARSKEGGIPKQDGGDSCVLVHLHESYGRKLKKSAAPSKGGQPSVSTKAVQARGRVYA